MACRILVEGRVAGERSAPAGHQELGAVAARPS